MQYAYDYAEDPWMMEATATWMEERIATQVNDNRQYFPWSQIYAANIPLDAFSRNAGYQYGNWVFWEHLSSNYGIDIVKKAWEQAGSLKQDGGKYSITALQKVLKRKGGLAKVYAKYAAGNLTPAVNFPEGAEYAFPKVRGGKQLSKGKRSKRFAVKINHLASASYVYAPGKGLDGKKWKLSLAVTGPVKRTTPAAVVVVHLLDGKRQVKMVRLNRGGDGRMKVSLRQPQGRRGLGDPGQRVDALHLRQAHGPGLPGPSARRQGALRGDGSRHALIASRAWSAATHSATSSDTWTGRSPVGTADQVSARSSV